MTIYDDMRSVALDVFAEFGQGDVRYMWTEAQQGGTPDEPLPGIPRNVKINSTVRPVSTKYVDGSHIVQSDRQVSMPNTGITPSMNGFVQIDGVSFKIIETMPRPSAGVPIVFILIVRR